MLQLLAPLTGPANEILTNTGAGLGKIIQVTETGEDQSGLLINDAIGGETPAAASRQPWITA